MFSEKDTIELKNELIERIEGIVLHIKNHDDSQLVMNELKRRTLEVLMMLARELGRGISGDSEIRYAKSKLEDAVIISNSISQLFFIVRDALIELAPDSVHAKKNSLTKP